MITGHQLAFFAIAAMTITSAILVVTIPNILRAALFLALMFLGIAGLYVLLNAELMAAFQVLIYVGAITVLIMFALVLTQQLMGAKLTQSTNTRIMVFAAPIAGLVFAFLAKSFIKPFGTGGAMYNEAPKAANATTLQTIAEMLLKPYVLPFELASFILLAALIGAIVIAKEDRD